MEQSSIDRLIINKPYEEPSEHWLYNRVTRKFSQEPGRRPAGYLIASGDSKTFDDPGMFVEIPWSTRFGRGSRHGGRPGIPESPPSPSAYWSTGLTRRSTTAVGSSSAN